MNRVYCATSGEVVEWPKALVLKTRDGKLSVGSNPTLSANYFYSDPNYFTPTPIIPDKRQSLCHSLGCSRLRLNPTLSVAYRQVSQRRKELNLTLSGRC